MQLSIISYGIKKWNEQFMNKSLRKKPRPGGSGDASKLPLYMLVPFITCKSVLFTQIQNVVLNNMNFIWYLQIKGVYADGGDAMKDQVVDVQIHSLQ